MVHNEGETPTTSSGATAQAATSSNRPIVMPEAFSASGNEEWDSWLSHFEDCAVINKWNDARKVQFLSVRIRGSALLQLQSLSPDVQGDYTNLKRALREQFVPKGRMELHKTEFMQDAGNGTRSYRISLVRCDDSSVKRIPRQFLICKTAL